MAKLLFSAICILCFTHLLHFSVQEGSSYELMRKFKTKFVTVTKKCSSDLNTSPVAALQVLDNDNSFLFLVPGKAKCYWLCLLQEFSLMDKNGTYQEDVLKALVSDMPKSSFTGVVKNKFDECLKEDSPNMCDKAFKFVKCFYDNKSAVTEDRARNLTSSGTHHVFKIPKKPETEN